VGEDQGEGHRVRGCDTVLFVDARHIYKQVDRAHREFSSDQIGFLANIVRLYRSKEPDFTLGGDEAKQKLLEIFGKAAGGNPKSKIENLKYRDVPGLCKVATIKEIEGRGWSLNPEKYGAGVRPDYGLIALNAPLKSRVGRLLAVLMGLQAGLPPLDFGNIKGRKRQEYFAAVRAGMDRDYEPMDKIFSDVIGRTLGARARQAVR